MKKLLAILVLAASAVLPAGAAEYFAKPVRLILPFPPGNPTDSMTRFVAERLAAEIGQAVYVENRAGAAGVVGSKVLADSVPDGYTIGVTSNGTHAAAGALFSKLPYDPVKDFTHIGRFVTIPWAFVVRSDLPARTVPEFLAYARANPGKLSTAHFSGSTRLSVAMLRAAAGLDFLDVPYNVPSQVLSDMRGGLLQFGFISPESAIAQQKGGVLRILAVSSAERWPALPDVPTLGEAIPGFEFVSWIGIGGPAGMPAEAVARLKAALAHVVTSPEMRERMAFFGATPVSSIATEDVPALIRRDIEQAGRLARQAGVKAE